jgi:hypothetical protein
LISSKEAWDRSGRLKGLRRFAIAITLLNVLGHTVLGFEQSWAQPLVALGTAYSLELLLELIDARVSGRTPHFIGGPRRVVDFFLSAHITGLAVAMLLYANDQLLPIAFASAVAIGGKAIFRVAAGDSSRHFFNPSNLGITAALLLFPWVGIAPPYQFTENVSGVWDWVLPGLIIASGSFLNLRLTHRLPLIGAWLVGFIVQALLRSVMFGTPLVAAWLPMTGLAFVLYTFYMVTDPATTPSGTRSQVIFGVSVATVYGLLMAANVVFGLFFALTIVCGLRGLGIYLQALAPRLAPSKVAVQASAVVRSLKP